jgi:hypothetical protein
MKEIQNFLVDFIILAEFLAALIAVLYFKKVKNTYWIWFAYYLIFIFCAELLSKTILSDSIELKKYYYNFFIIPIEFLFFYWLYAIKSLGKKKLFYVISSLYLLSYFPLVFFKVPLGIISSPNYVIGTLLLGVLILLEFLNQIKSDEILYFKQNKMFYINVGVVLFYVGTLPFYAFHYVLLTKNITLWNNYGTFALAACACMYFLFAASFIWGKPNM